jgi:hypothetical protein
MRSGIENFGHQETSAAGEDQNDSKIVTVVEHSTANRGETHGTS